MTDMKHMEYLDVVAREDVENLREKEKTYQGSWKRRGGVGAFMMLARKWDRLENMLSDKNPDEQFRAWDIFWMIDEGPDGEDGTALAEIRDLRRYLILVEAEMMARGSVRNAPEPRVPRRSVVSDYYRKTLPLSRLEDGLTSYNTSDSTPALMTRYEDTDYWNVDRRLVPRDRWDHLPRLFTEVNTHEYMHKVRPEYRGMYTFDAGHSKWILAEEYKNCWGREY